VSDDRPLKCGDCGAYKVSSEGGNTILDHFPDCLTLQERAAGVEVATVFSNESPRRCPRCGSVMTRNHDRQSDAWTDNCTGGVCGVTVEVPRAPDHARQVLPPDPISPAAAFDAIAAMPDAQVFEEPYPGEGELCPSCLQPVRPETGEPFVQDGEVFFHKPCWDDSKEGR